jgi:hypothetical protein
MTTQFYLHAISTLKPNQLARFITQDLIEVRPAASNAGWIRLATCSSLSGVPSRVVEVYDGTGPEAVLGALDVLENNPVYQRLMGRCEQREVELLSRMSYAPSRTLDANNTASSHLLHVLLTVKNGDLNRFSELMTQVLPTFDRNGWTLLAAGHGLQPPHRVMHLWRSPDANNLNKLMGALSESIPYMEINANTIQHQDLMHGIGAFKGPGGGNTNMGV